MSMWRIKIREIHCFWDENFPCQCFIRQIPMTNEQNLNENKIQIDKREFFFAGFCVNFMINLGGNF